MEEWKVIENYPDYMISNLGRVKSFKHDKIDGKIMILKLNKGKYHSITLCNNNIKSFHLIHRLVAIAFIPNEYNKCQVNHIDNNRINNNLSNLEWCTPFENTQHYIKQGRKFVTIGESHGMSKLTWKEVNEIRLNEYKLNQRQLALVYNIHFGTISDIINNKKWKIKKTSNI